MKNFKDYQPASDCLAQRVILVTGAGAGIGRYLATTLAEHGATVILAGRTPNKLEQVYDDIMAKKAPEPVILPVDLKGATVDDYARIRDLISDELGRLDGLVHNAAVLGGLTQLSLTEPKNWLAIMQTNLNAPFLLTQALLPLLKQAEHGRILFTGDALCDTGKAYWGAYSVSKAGLTNLMQILADECEVNTPIRVNTIVPPPTLSRIRKQAFPTTHHDPLSHPKDYMAAYLYLLGPDSQAVHGQIVRL